MPIGWWMNSILELYEGTERGYSEIHRLWMCTLWYNYFQPAHSE